MVNPSESFSRYASRPLRSRRSIIDRSHWHEAKQVGSGLAKCTTIPTARCPVSLNRTRSATGFKRCLAGTERGLRFAFVQGSIDGSARTHDRPGYRSRSSTPRCHRNHQVDGPVNQAIHHAAERPINSSARPPQCRSDEDQRHRAKNRRTVCARRFCPHSQLPGSDVRCRATRSGISRGKGRSV
jgi:hypothetical protein